ncbi:MAG: hypothetical protein M3Y27_11605, partial [Acidobacteriota bacterium]|nr:hypothetical protein [Acidobacteriota bacterium]
MLARQKLTVLLALVALALFTVPAIAGPIVCVVNGSQQFGTVDVGTGAFRQIGPNTPEAEVGGLVPGPNGSLLTLAGSGNLDRRFRPVRRPRSIRWFEVRVNGRSAIVFGAVGFPGA